MLRDVRTEGDGTVVVEVTPTYTGCPAMGAMRADLVHTLRDAGFEHVDVRTVLGSGVVHGLDLRRRPAEARPGRDRAAGRGLASGRPGPVPLDLGQPPRSVACPLCGSADTEAVSEFGATACTALRRCRACQEPFEHVKER